MLPDASLPPPPPTTRIATILSFGCGNPYSSRLFLASLLRVCLQCCVQQRESDIVGVEASLARGSRRSRQRDPLPCYLSRGHGSVTLFLAAALLPSCCRIRQLSSTLQLMGRVCFRPPSDWEGGSIAGYGPGPSAVWARVVCNDQQGSQ